VVELMRIELTTS